MNASPAISYVIPTLNSAATLETTVISLRSQVGAMLQIFVVDSGSMDETLAICQRVKVKTLYVEPGNMYRALNAGLQQCQTEWLAYLNSDDWLYPDCLQRLLEIGVTSGADVVYGNCDYCDHRGRFVYSFAAARPAQLLPLFRTGRMGFAQPAAIFRRSLYERLQGFDVSYKFKADADFFIRALLAGARFVYVEGPAVACFRLHAGQFSNRAADDIAVEGQRLFSQTVLAAGWRDRLTLWQWQLRNVPHYLIRILRESSLSRRLRLPRAIETYDHQ
jgi:glycosyltransferase involved in cell wall biosynthesis